MGHRETNKETVIVGKAEKDLENKINSLNASASDLSGKRDSLIQQVESLEATKESLSEDVANLSKKIVKLNERANEVELETDKLESERLIEKQAIEAQITSLKIQAQEKEGLVTKIENDGNSLIESYQKQASQLEAQIEILKEDKSKAEKFLKFQEEGIVQLENQAIGLNEVIPNLEASVSRLDDEIKKRTAALEVIETLEKQRDALYESIKVAQADLAKVLKERESLPDIFSKKEAELNDLKNALDGREGALKLREENLTKREAAIIKNAQTLQKHYDTQEIPIKVYPFSNG